jgi:hypothetical protein
VPEQDVWKQGLEPKVADQVDYIVTEFDNDGREVGLVTANGGVGFMYAEGQILVRYESLRDVREVLASRFDFPRTEPVVPGIVLQYLEPKARRRATPKKPPSPIIKRESGVIVPRPATDRPFTVIEAVELVDTEVGEGAAAPDHILTVAPVSPCPATEPVSVYDGIEPCPGVCKENSGADVLIYIADTGLLKDADSQHPWLHGVRRGFKVDGQLQDWEIAEVMYHGKPTIPPYAGHGTFVAGVARCMAPQSSVIVSNAFRIAGSALESHFVQELTRALRLGVDIFHLSVTTPSRHDLPLLAFERWLKLLRRYKGVVCVVAAGNSNSRHPFWPAAFPEVVSVGALAADLRNRADFSNYGGWVDVYAPGRDLINAYATGTYTCRDAPYKGQDREFYGMAQWSGTSFSTPIVTGLVAARMSRTGENGKEAAAALLEVAQAQAIPAVGAVLLPCCGTGTGVTRHHGECCCAHHQRPGCPYDRCA